MPICSRDVCSHAVLLLTESATAPLAKNPWVLCVHAPKSAILLMRLAKLIVETNGCPLIPVLLLEVDTVGTRVWVFVSFEVVQGHPKLSKDCITQVLELACMDKSSVSHRLASVSQLSLAA